ncbi:DUF3717 domain-containing protein [Massilia sp. TS11]|uniref:DUF3717 domain-containing protein n=1 Tax=Massilia sp. TS11 TaxID=2908003 RepID=UPI001EDA14C6|nr:DUF3717 domain-containing protein [Massilia sp. TS11]MCG2585370.1 DUF3717 domain-containing protein [Massilia sp. TS11]
MECSLAQLESAINFWRARLPARGPEGVLAPELSALATLYGRMIYERRACLDTAALDSYPRGLIEAALTQQ